MAKAASSGGPGNRPSPPSGQRTGARRFVRESWAELRKVQWPTRQQVATGTLVVAVVTATFAAYISAVDQVAVRLVDQVNKALGI
ncbi:MAG: SecE/Sec61-gamma subunit of protein translocation complex [Thermoleophilia bacterium]|nr:SecE/Sec61-gamma subunit of protein translocation complex [Thermoleophilia bacterium]